MIRIDLHTHSEASKDGSIKPEQYAEILENEILDVVAITDHNRIDFATGMQKALGEKYIIVGEEIMTSQGEIIGLFLTKNVEPGMSAQRTVDEIKSQDGIVYIPHPFEKVRSGIPLEILNAIKPDVDIIEGFNGRAISKKHGLQALAWGKRNNVAVASSSDAHGKKAIGYAHTSITKRPSKNTLARLIKSGQIVSKKPPLYTLGYPKLNRLLSLLRGQGL